VQNDQKEGKKDGDKIATDAQTINYVLFAKENINRLRCCERKRKFRFKRIEFVAETFLKSKNMYIFHNYPFHIKSNRLFSDCDICI